jgi:hypothetical protein
MTHGPKYYHRQQQHHKSRVYREQLRIQTQDRVDFVHYAGVSGRRADYPVGKPQKCLCGRLMGGLMQEKLHVQSPPLGTTKLSDWVCVSRDEIGRRYASELQHRLDRENAYHYK